MRFYDIDVEYFTKRMIVAEDKTKVVQELAGLIVHSYDYAAYELKKEIEGMVQQANDEVLDLTCSKVDREALLELINDNLKPITLSFR